MNLTLLAASAHFLRGQGSLNLRGCVNWNTWKRILVKCPQNLLLNVITFPFCTGWIFHQLTEVTLNSSEWHHNFSSSTDRLCHQCTALFCCCYAGGLFWYQPIFFVWCCSKTFIMQMQQKLQIVEPLLMFYKNF